MVMIESIAIRVCRMDAMTEFYTEALGAHFRDVTVGELQCRFGILESVEIRLVPLRGETDFSGFPVQQLGFRCEDVTRLDRVLDTAVRSGGRVQDARQRLPTGDWAASVRDPDGNTIELTAPDE